MTIKESVINTFKRVGIDWEKWDNTQKTAMAYNRFSGEGVSTTPLISHLVSWVYQTSNDYENGKQEVKVSDFDRIRYFILNQQPDVYSTCID